MTILDEDGVDARFRRVVASGPWVELERAFETSRRVFLFGNGGNLLVAQHGAADIARLTGKHAQAPGSIGLASALIQDRGFEEWLMLWLETESRGLNEEMLGGCIAIGLSASGDSDNVFAALQSAARLGMRTALISGASPMRPPPGILIDLDARYYHLAETTSLLLLYQLIASTGIQPPRLPE